MESRPIKRVGSRHWRVTPSLHASRGVSETILDELEGKDMIDHPDWSGWKSVRRWLLKGETDFFFCLKKIDWSMQVKFEHISDVSAELAWFLSCAFWICLQVSGVRLG